MTQLYQLITKLFCPGVKINIDSRYCDKSSPGPVVSPKGTVGLEMHLHTNSEGVFSGFKGRYQFMQAKNEFGDCGGNISNSENGVIKSPNYPEKYSTNDPSKNCLLTSV